MPALQELLDKQLELINFIYNGTIEDIQSFVTDNAENINQILNTQHTGFHKTDPEYIIRNPQGDLYKYHLVKCDTPLTASIKLLRHDVLTFLLEAGADINISEPQLTYEENIAGNKYNTAEHTTENDLIPWKKPLHCAFQTGHFESIWTLLLYSRNYNIDINSMRDWENNDIFYYIWGPGQGVIQKQKVTETLSLLTKFGYEFDGRNIKIDNTPLLEAICEFNEIPTAMMLIRQGADININIGEETFFEYACRRNEKILIEECIKQNAVNIRYNSTDLPGTLNDTVINNTIALAKNIYGTLSDNKDYTYPALIYRSVTTDISDLLPGSGVISPSLLLAIKIADIPVYEWLVIHAHRDTNILEHLNNYSNEPIFGSTDTHPTLAGIVNFLASCTAQDNVKTFCTKLQALISPKLYVAEAIRQQEFSFAKTLGYTENLDSSDIINALLKVSSDTNLSDVTEIAGQYLPSYNPQDNNLDSMPPSYFRDLIKVYNSNSSDEVSRYINHLKQMTDPCQKSLTASSLLQFLSLKGELMAEFAGSLKELIISFNAEAPIFTLAGNEEMISRLKIEIETQISGENIEETFTE